MNTIPWWKAGTLRGLIVAALALLLERLGLADQFPESGKYVDYVLNGIEALALAYAAWKRTTAANPPITQAAVKMVAERARTMQSSLFAAILSLLAVMALVGPLAGCQSNALAASRAETPEQIAAALLGDFNIYQSASIRLAKDESLSAEVRRAVAAAAIAAKPFADELDKALMQYRAVVRELARGVSVEDKVAIAAANLSKWIRETTPLVKSLRQTVEGVAT